jgi:hypothetical protein
LQVIPRIQGRDWDYPKSATIECRRTSDSIVHARSGDPDPLAVSARINDEGART